MIGYVTGGSLLQETLRRQVREQVGLAQSRNNGRLWQGGNDQEMGLGRGWTVAMMGFPIECPRLYLARLPSHQAVSG